MKEAKAGWEKAVDSMPSGWDVIGMQFVETLTNTVSNLSIISVFDQFDRHHSDNDQTYRKR